mmetsp:Transcript_47306/g.126581  ORF Transcript_47306/g.126581 Transcript_47306/m.126581 type:complete len:285 (-) Transcript_47306:160-1014(-)
MLMVTVSSGRRRRASGASRKGASARMWTSKMPSRPTSSPTTTSPLRSTRPRSSSAFRYCCTRTPHSSSPWTPGSSRSAPAARGSPSKRRAGTSSAKAQERASTRRASRAALGTTPWTSFPSRPRCAATQSRPSTMGRCTLEATTATTSVASTPPGSSEVRRAPPGRGASSARRSLVAATSQAKTSSLSGATGGQMARSLSATRSRAGGTRSRSFVNPSWTISTRRLATSCSRPATPRRTGQRSRSARSSIASFAMAYPGPSRHKGRLAMMPVATRTPATMRRTT